MKRQSDREPLVEVNILLLPAELWRRLIKQSICYKGSSIHELNQLLERRLVSQHWRQASELLLLEKRHIYLNSSLGLTDALVSLLKNLQTIALGTTSPDALTVQGLTYLTKLHTLWLGENFDLAHLCAIRTEHPTVLPSLTSLSLSVSNWSEHFDVTTLPALTHLDMGFGFNARGIKNLIAMSALTSLTLNSRGLYEIGPTLLQMTQLRSLSLGEDTLYLKQCVVSRLTALTCLRAEDHSIRLRGKELAPLTNLRELAFNEQCEFRDEQLSMLTALTRLELPRKYDGSARIAVTDASIRLLGNLTHLDCGDDYVPSDTVLASLTGLKTLCIYVRREPERPTDASLSCLTNLTVLDLRGREGITFNCLAALPSLKKLVTGLTESITLEKLRTLRRRGEHNFVRVRHYNDKEGTDDEESRIVS